MVREKCDYAICDMLSGGYLLWAKVINRLRDWIHLRVVSSFRTCATWAAKIFSRAERSWILQSTSSISDIQRARLEMVFYNLPNHCNTNGPRWVAYGKLEIWVLRISVESALHTMRYFRNSGKNIGLHGLEMQDLAATTIPTLVNITFILYLWFELLEQRPQIVRCLLLHGGRSLALSAALDFFWTLIHSFFPFP